MNLAENWWGCSGVVVLRSGGNVTFTGQNVKEENEKILKNC